MAPTNPFLSAVPLNQLYVWVLAPYVESSDANINYYYDFPKALQNTVAPSMNWVLHGNGNQLP